MSKPTILETKEAQLKNWIVENNGLPDYNDFIKTTGSNIFKDSKAFINFYCKNYISIMKSAQKNVTELQLKERLKLIKKGEIKRGMWNIDTVAYTNNKIKVTPFNASDTESKTIFDNTQGILISNFATIFDNKIGISIMKVYKVQFTNGLGTRYLMIDIKGESHIRLGYAWITDFYEKSTANRKRYKVLK